MTGFGTAVLRTKQGHLEVTVRSVNNRFFEPRLHLGRDFLRFEPQVRKALASHFQRGSVEIFISRKSDPSQSVQVHLNEKVVAQYWSQVQKLAKKYKALGGSLQVDTLIRLPEVVQVEAHQEVSVEETKAFLALVEKALRLCSEERAREGKAIARDLQGHLSALQKKVEKMEGLRLQANDLLKKKMEQRLTSRSQDLPLDPARLSQEVVYLLDKADISEEIARLKEHLSFLQSNLESAEANGKKLEFYIQELHREVNTIGSKSQHLELTQLVVDAKTRIEKLREQVQNIE